MGLTELVEKQKALFEEIKKDGQGLLKEEFRKFFEAHPEVDAIRWAQYTPYFNDGDACVFGRRDFSSRSKASEDFADHYEHESAEQKTALEAIQKALGAGELDDIFEAAFGDHVEVTATREAFIVEEYLHD